jgi:hypothetical protein
MGDREINIESEQISFNVDAEEFRIYQLSDQKELDLDRSLGRNVSSESPCKSRHSQGFSISDIQNVFHPENMNLQQQRYNEQYKETTNFGAISSGEKQENNKSVESFDKAPMDDGKKYC